MVAQQYIYCLQDPEPAVFSNEQAAARVANIVDVLKFALQLVSAFGLTDGIKRALRVGSKSRESIYWIEQGKLVAEAQICIGFCKLYPVASNDIVIGPVWTSPDQRGKGIATKLLQAACNFYGGNRAYWIDTAEDNIGMQKAIMRVGFTQLEESIDRNW